MPTTPLGLPFPSPSDTVEVPRDLEALADKADHLLARKGGPLGFAAATLTKQIVPGSGGQIQLTLSNLKPGTRPVVVALINGNAPWMLTLGAVTSTTANLFMKNAPDGLAGADNAAITLDVIVVGELDPISYGPPVIS